MKKEKQVQIEIGGVVDAGRHWDFGFLPYPQKKVKVSKDLWQKFVKARNQYEILYEKIRNYFE